VVLPYCWAHWPQALEIVAPETVLRWRRRGRRPKRRWPWQGRRLGRPPVDRETRRLIRRLNLDNFFSNGFVPSLSQLTRAAEGLFMIEDLHNSGPHYDPTPMAWRENFEQAWPKPHCRLVGT
jgi:hypothetical protein